MSIYALYHVDTANLEDARSLLERALSITFDERDSDYHGGQYFVCGDENAEHFLLKQNIDPYDGEPAEQNFPDSRMLLYANDTGRADEIDRQISLHADVIRRLRREEL